MHIRYNGIERQVSAAQFQKIQDAGYPIVKKSAAMFEIWGDTSPQKIDQLIGPVPQRVYNKMETCEKLRISTKTLDNYISSGKIMPGRYVSVSGKSFWALSQIEETLRSVGAGRGGKWKKKKK